MRTPTPTPTPWLTLAAAQRIGDPVLTAWLHGIVGGKAVRLGEVATGRRHVDEARAFYARVGDRVGEANTLWQLADLTEQREEQVEYLRRASPSSTRVRLRNFSTG